MKKFLKKLIDRFDKTAGQEPMEWYEIIPIIEEVAEKENYGWILCDEQLPEVVGDYLISFKMKYTWEKEWEYFVDVATFEENEGRIDKHWTTFCDWNEGQEFHVIAWQPLPEPLRI